MPDLVDALVAALVFALLGLAVIIGARVVLTVAGRRWKPATWVADACRKPFRVMVVVLSVTGWVHSITPRDDSDWWWTFAQLALRIVSIGVGAWLLTSVLLFLEDLTLGRARTDVKDNRVARRVRTQILLIRRLTVAVVVIIAVGAILLSFPGVRALGASVLASAGLISVVAALAAQSTLANVFAGIQLAFNDAIKVDDAVIVENEWGWIEEITLSYVVVRIWDERRLILPSTYFISNPFQNWTRKSSELMGTVEFDLDWRVDTLGMREALTPLLEDAGAMWDGRVGHFQITDAVGGWVHVRILVTAVDAPTLYDLRCHVREGLIRWVREHNPEGLPTQRVMLTPPGVGEPPASHQA
ncbi:mechanosensitive ion channel family protein [Nocardioides bruguierae]|uniref:Mechanosensitive ion channel family protein n=1 Tax=Nocardioides bruguierae TaxID=2945102 RepID=A0A9X2D8F5_9ACTN|nr:mechanosensitive ion channel domain-containing protein [Nocardioides bruguierae]MCM0621213.1 mechanosensitive ion channel family protein [Nocardioides bruguierae]